MVESRISISKCIWVISKIPSLQNQSSLTINWLVTSLLSDMLQFWEVLGCSIFYTYLYIWSISIYHKQIGFYSCFASVIAGFKYHFFYFQSWFRIYVEIDFDFETTAIYPLNTDTQWYASPNIRWLFSGSFSGSLKLMTEIETSNLHKMFLDPMLSYTTFFPYNISTTSYEVNLLYILHWSYDLSHAQLFILIISRAQH